jgi:hypothetical protein
VAAGQRKQQTIGTDDLYNLWKAKKPLGWPFSIKNPDPLNLPESDLKIDPWILGAWLGDGYSGSGMICAGAEDYDNIRKLITERWGTFSERTDSRNLTTFTLRGSSKVKGERRCGMLTSLLRNLDVLNNKHIPAEYLRGSHEQRLALLQGLMDTDGSWNSLRKRAVFVNTNEQLARDTAELVASLGITPQFNEINNNGYIYYRVEFSAYKINPFLLVRKANAVVLNDRNSANKRYIESIEKVDSVPTQCIQVDTLDSLYLAGPLMTPTHNTSGMDKKTGKPRKKTKDHGQVALYTAAAKRRFPGERVKASLYWLRCEKEELKIDTHEFSDEEIATFEERMNNTVAEIIEDENYQVTKKGFVCQYCNFANEDVCRFGAAAGKRQYGWQKKQKARK